MAYGGGGLDFEDVPKKFQNILERFPLQLGHAVQLNLNLKNDKPFDKHKMLEQFENTPWHS